VQVSEDKTLTETLAEAGYWTTGFHSNPFLSRVFGFNKGFHDFYDDLFLGGITLPPKLRLLVNRVPRLLRIRPYLPGGPLTRKVLAWLDRAQEPFFLWVHYMDAHGPHQPPGSWSYWMKVRAEKLWQKAAQRPEDVTEAERDFMIDAYRKEITSVDAHLARLLRSLSEKDLLDRSIIVLTADHGDEFGEHGRYQHSHQVYDELIHVPLIIKHPGVKSRTIDTPVELVQIFPTIMKLLGQSGPENLDRESLLPLMEMNKADVRDYTMSEAEIVPNYIGCIRRKEWKFIQNERSGKQELYHLLSDPGEKTNVINAHPGVAQEMRQMLMRHRDGESPQENATNLTPADEQLIEERLRDLGYLE